MSKWEATVETKIKVLHFILDHYSSPVVHFKSDCTHCVERMFILSIRVIMITAEVFMYKSWNSKWCYSLNNRWDLGINCFWLVQSLVYPCGIIGSIIRVLCLQFVTQYILCFTCIPKQRSVLSKAFTFHLTVERTQFWKTVSDKA